MCVHACSGAQHLYMCACAHVCVCVHVPVEAGAFLSHQQLHTLALQLAQTSGGSQHRGGQGLCSQALSPSASPRGCHGAEVCCWRATRTCCGVTGQAGTSEAGMGCLSALKCLRIWGRCEEKVGEVSVSTDSSASGGRRTPRWAGVTRPMEKGSAQAPFAQGYVDALFLHLHVT